jgi:hypothetical protein
MLVSTGSTIQRYEKLFTLILRLRMICDQGKLYGGLGSLQSGAEVTEAMYPIHAEVGHDLGCDSCRDEELFSLETDLIFCPSCSRILPHSISDGPCNTTESSRSPGFCSPGLNIGPVGDVRPLTGSPSTSLDTNVGVNLYPTKISAVAGNLRDNARHSKRFVKSSNALEVLQL